MEGKERREEDGKGGMMKRKEKRETDAVKLCILSSIFEPPTDELNDEEWTLNQALHQPSLFSSLPPLLHLM